MPVRRWHSQNMIDAGRRREGYVRSLLVSLVVEGEDGAGVLIGDGVIQVLASLRTGAS